MSNYILPGHYKVKSAILESHSGKKINISNLIPSFSIEEGLNSAFVKGSADVVDNLDLISNFPIIGEEKLELKVTDSLNKTITYEMSVYKTSDIEIKNTNDGVTYKLHFMSTSTYEAMFSRIIEPFNNDIAKSVSDIFVEHFPGNKPITIEGTTGIFRCVMPNYTPIQALNFLAQRSYSSKSPSCSFRFFETASRYYFVSDEFLIDSHMKDQDKIKEFSYSDAVEKSGKEYVKQMQNFIELSNPDNANTLTDLSSGAYRSRAIEIDLNYRRINLPGKSNKHEYKYEEAKSGYVQVPGTRNATVQHTKDFIDKYFTEENERRYLVVKDWDEEDSLQIRGNQYIPEIVTNRVAYRHHLNGIPIFAKIHGRLDVNVGDVIKIDVPEFTYSSSKQINKKLSGYYLVHDLIHSFIRDVHETSLKLVKYDWNKHE